MMFTLCTENREAVEESPRRWRNGSGEKRNGVSRSKTQYMSVNERETKKRVQAGCSGWR